MAVTVMEMAELPSKHALDTLVLRDIRKDFRDHQ